jgi:hypothetical protein
LPRAIRWPFVTLDVGSPRAYQLLAADVRTIMGKKSTESPACLGGKIFDEVIHRNNMVRL